MSEDAVRRQLVVAEELLTYIARHREGVAPQVQQQVRAYFYAPQRTVNLRTEHGTEACSD